MVQPNFDYEGALNAGYSEDEIKQFLSQSPPNPKEKVPSQQDVGNMFEKIKNFDYQGAIDSGYSPDEINEFLQAQKPERSTLEQVGRIGGQFALGAAESALLPYELAVAPLALPGGQEALGDLFTREILNDVYPTEEEGKFVGQRELKEPIDIGVRGLAEKATGLDLKPEGFLEKAANWMGFLKSFKFPAVNHGAGVTAKEIAKAIAPTGSEVLRGVGAGAALELAEDNEFGPIGTIAAAIVGDVAGGGVSAVAKGAKNLVTNPKKKLAELTAAFTPKDKLNLQKDIIKEFREAGLQADLGTITDSNLVKMTQARLSQSGLTGKALQEFREGLTNQIKEEYKVLADALGEAKHASTHEAGMIAKEGMKSIREADLEATRKLYQNANNALKESSYVESKKLSESIAKLEKELKPGSIKSVEQNAVLNALEKIKKDIHTPSGKLKLSSVKDLMNNKIALNDIINYEVQGGAKQLLKGIVGELDRAIISHGKENIPFVRNYVNANKRFSQHAKTFRNKTAKQLMNAEDPSQLINKMGTVQGIKEMSTILSKTPEGKKIFEELKRFKLDKMIGDNLVDSTSQQVKLGTFSKLLEKGKNKEIAKELLGKEGFKRLERLQKNSGRLADSTNKFFNASQSGVVATDAAILAKGMTALGNALAGNPWGIIKILGGILGARRLSKLLADPEFLKLAEDVILASEKGNQQAIFMTIERIKPYILEAMQEIKS